MNVPHALAVLCSMQECASRFPFAHMIPTAVRQAALHTNNKKRFERSASQLSPLQRRHSDRKALAERMNAIVAFTPGSTC